MKRYLFIAGIVGVAGIAFSLVQAKKPVETSAKVVLGKQDEGKVKEAKITLTESGFEPRNITIKIGTKVVWVNKSSTIATVDSGDDAVHDDYPPLNLGEFYSGQSLELIFTRPGNYKFHDHYDETNEGTVIVEN